TMTISRRSNLRVVGASAGLLILALALLAALLAPALAQAAPGDLAYVGCVANRSANGCQQAAHNSLDGAAGVAVSRDDKSVYVASATGVTAFKRAATGALAYRGCFANQGHHGCQAGTHNSLRKSRDLAVSADGKSLYVASAGAITAFGR